MSAETPFGRRLEYNDTGRLAGNCTLTCHGVLHIEFPYINSGVSRLAPNAISRRGKR